MVEYAYIHTLNGKVIGLRPGTQEGFSAVLDPADYDAVLQRLRNEGGWEPVNTAFRPAVAGASLIRIWRDVSSEPIIPGNLHVERVEVRSSLPDSEVEKTKHEREVNGWDLKHIVGKDRRAEFMTLVFTKPKAALI